MRGKAVNALAHTLSQKTQNHSHSVLEGQRNISRALKVPRRNFCQRTEHHFTGAEEEEVKLSSIREKLTFVDQ